MCMHTDNHVVRLVSLDRTTSIWPNFRRLRVGPVAGREASCQLAVRRAVFYGGTARCCYAPPSSLGGILDCWTFPWSRFDRPRFGRHAIAERQPDSCQRGYADICLVPVGSPCLLCRLLLPLAKREVSRPNVVPFFFASCLLTMTPTAATTMATTPSGVLTLARRRSRDRRIADTYRRHYQAPSAKLWMWMPRSTDWWRASVICSHSASLKEFHDEKGLRDNMNGNLPGNARDMKRIKAALGAVSGCATHIPVSQ